MGEPVLLNASAPTASPREPDPSAMRAVEPADLPRLGVAAGPLADVPLELSPTTNGVRVLPVSRPPLEPVDPKLGVYRVRVLERVEDVEALGPAHERLAANALEPNVFLSPWFLNPAVRRLRDREELRVVVVEAIDPQSDRRPPLLTALLPLELRRRFRGVPLASSVAWKHRHAFVGGPLVHRDAVERTLTTLFDWIETDRLTGSLMELKSFRMDGPLARAWFAEVRRRELPWHAGDLWSRALLERGVDGESYLNDSLRGKKRKELRRIERRLSELGRLEYARLDDSARLEDWCREFLELEQSGWKGRENTALDRSESDRLWFIEISRAALARGDLQALAIRLDGRAIAMKWNFRSGPLMFAFKIAYDESLAAYSPGLLLELENVRRFHAETDAVEVDSCADPDHPMIDHVWSGRRMFADLVLSTGRRFGDLAVGMLPLVKRARRLLSRRSPRPANPGPSTRASEGTP
jgi:CelD/BcsL family acetyltransferase involved in cellulose biosynthesis